MRTLCSLRVRRLLPCLCRLEVSAADPSTRAAALAAAQAAGAAAHAARMEQQEKTIRQFRAVEQLLMA